jgi:hypothetical protein
MRACTRTGPRHMSEWCKQRVVEKVGAGSPLCQLSSIALPPACYLLLRYRMCQTLPEILSILACPGLSLSAGVLQPPLQAAQALRAPQV